VPAALARRVAAAEVLASVCDIVGLAQGSRFGVEEVARTYFALGSRFALDRLRRAAAALGRDDRWEAAAADGLIHDLFAHQGAMTRSVLAGAGDGAEAARAAWLVARGGLVARIDQLLAEIDAPSRPELPMLAVLTHHLRLLVDG
jgi:glutamate dehydrogenase